MKKKFNWQLFLIFIIILFLTAFNFGYGNDYYWHVKIGEYITTNFKIPYYDIFSWYGTINNLYWMSHEWLSEVVLYIYRFIFKDYGPIIFTFSIYLFLIIILFMCNKKSLEKNKIFTLAWALLGVLAFSRVMLPRPHMISYILLAFTIYVLYDNFNNEKSKKIYFLPLISMLWANFHGGSSNLPYILCFLFLLSGLFKFKFSKIEADKISKVQIKKYIVCGLLSVLAIIINPHGLKMLSYPYINMQDSLMISSITEWASPSLNNLDYEAFALLGFIILTMIITKKNIKLVELIVLGAFLVLGFKSLKFIPMLYIVATFMICNFVSVYEVKIPKLIIVTLVVALLGSYGLFVPKFINNCNKKLIPDEVINYIKEKKPERLFNFYDFGGYLIYNDIPVFIDGRADMYSKYNLKDAIDLQNNGYHHLLSKYDFDMFVIPYSIPLNNYLANNENYTSVKQTTNVVVYEKVQ